MKPYLLTVLVFISFCQIAYQACLNEALFNCTKCDSEFSKFCLECQEGFYLKNYFCYPNVKQCIDQASEKKCNKCADNFIVIQGHSNLGIDFDICKAENCQVFAKSDEKGYFYDYSKCQQCMDGYTLQLFNYSCKYNYHQSSSQKGGMPYGCKILKKSSKQSCEQCQDGYILKSDKCLKDTQNSSSYSAIDLFAIYFAFFCIVLLV